MGGGIPQLRGARHGYGLLVLGPLFREFPLPRLLPGAFHSEEYCILGTLVYNKILKHLLIYFQVSYVLISSKYYLFWIFPLECDFILLVT